MERPRAVRHELRPTQWIPRRLVLKPAARSAIQDEEVAVRVSAAVAENSINLNERLAHPLRHEVEPVRCIHCKCRRRPCERRRTMS